MTNIVFASDSGYVRQLLVASGSAVYALRHPMGGGIRIHVLDCGIDAATWDDYSARIHALAAKVGADVSLVRHVVDMARLNRLEGWTNGSKAIWARLLIPELLPDVDQCVYSDCDMLFVADPAEMLDSLQDPNVLIAGHFDIDDTRRTDADWCREQGLPVSMDDYICSGLIAMNLKGFREEGVAEKCLDFGLRHSNIPFPDQTALNQVCLGRKALLPDGWGVLYPKECFSFAGRIKAIHFAGGTPWQKKYANGKQTLCSKLLQPFNALWHDFETRILGVPATLPVRPSFVHRLQAEVALIVSLLANALGVKVGNGAFQKTVAFYRGARPPALEGVREELFGPTA